MTFRYVTGMLGGWRMKSPEEKIEKGESRTFARQCALQYFEHVEGQVILAHNKANILVAANALISVFLVTLYKELKLAEWLPRGLELVLGMALLTVLAGLVTALFASQPTSKKKYGGKCADDQDPDSTKFQDSYFYRTIVCKTRAEVVEEGLAITDEEAERALWVGIYGKAEWTRVKFRIIRIAIFCTVVGLIAFVGTVAIASIIREF